MESNNQIKVYEPAPRPLARPRPAPALRGETLEMQEPTNLLAYWRVVRKRRWTVLTVLFVLFTVVLLGTLKQKPVYRANALLEIEKENPNILTLQELFALDTVSDSYLETQYKILRSDSLARRVIDQFHLDRSVEFNPNFAPRRDTISKSSVQAPAVVTASAERDPRGYQTTLHNFRDRLSVDPVKRSRLVEISFESHNAELAAQVVNGLASHYIEHSLEVRWEATQRASEWLSQQLLDLKARLEKSEHEMQTYARENGLLFLESERGTPENIVNERLRELQQELTRAQAARYQKEALYRLAQAGDYDSLPDAGENRVIADLSLRLAELRRDHAQLSATFTSDYPKVRQVQNQIEEIERLIEAERARMASRVTNDYLAAVRRENLVAAAFSEEQKQANVVAGRSVQYSILKREVETNKQLYEGLLGRLKEAGVSAGLKASNIRVVDSAEPPRQPTRPNLTLNLALALVLGMGLGVGAAFLQEHLDNSLKTSEDVERFLGIPALALIPSVESLNGHRGRSHSLSGGGRLLGNGRGKLETPPQPPRWYRIDAESTSHSVLAEAFRGLRTSVLLSTADRPPRTLLVSSSQPGEGKTTISVNLAISLSQLGQRVLLIDCDMRRPSIRKAFSLENNLGLVSYLTGQQDWRAAVQPSGLANLDALVCGPVPPNPAELLSSERMRLLLSEARAEYQFVVMDSPPLLNLADSRILATLAEGVVLVVKGGATPRELAQRAGAYARDVGANLIGAVLNNLDVRSDTDYYYRYYRYDYYGAEPQPGSQEKD